VLLSTDMGGPDPSRATTGISNHRSRVVLWKKSPRQINQLIFLTISITARGSADSRPGAKLAWNPEKRRKD